MKVFLQDDGNDGVVLFNRDYSEYAFPYFLSHYKQVLGKYGLDVLTDDCLFEIRDELLEELLMRYEVKWQDVKYYMAFRAPTPIAIGYIGGKESEDVLLYKHIECQIEIG